MPWISRRRSTLPPAPAAPAAPDTPADRAPLTDAEADALGMEVLVAQGLSTAQATSALYIDLFGFDSADWRYDLGSGEIAFTPTLPGLRVTAPMQVVGTYDPTDGTWLWGWDHPSVPDHVAVAAKRVHAFGLRNGIPELTTRRIACTEDDAWRFTQLALRLGTETCAYRGPTPGARIFMTFGDISMSSGGAAWPDPAADAGRPQDT